MSTEVRWRHGTTAEHASFTGAPSEVTVDTNKHVVVVHDGVTAGGFPSISQFSLDSLLASYAPLNSPALTGNPTAPTQTGSDNSTRLATTAFVKGLNYAPIASPAFTGVPVAPTAAVGTSTTQLATTAYVLTATSTLVPVVRHAIQYGPTTGSYGASDLIPQSQIGRTLAQGVIAKFSTKATYISFASGFNVDGTPNNTNVLYNVDMTSPVLSAATTNYIVLDQVNNNLLVVTVADVDTKGGTPAVTNNLYTLDYLNWVMYKGNGTTAVPVKHLILAEVDTNATVVVGIRCRAYLREAEMDQLAGIASTETNVLHNLGTRNYTVYPEIECITTDAGYSVGHRVPWLLTTNGGGAVGQSVGNLSKNTSSYLINSSWMLVSTRGTTGGAVTTLANWKARMRVKGNY